MQRAQNATSVLSATPSDSIDLQRETRPSRGDLVAVAAFAATTAAAALQSEIAADDQARGVSL
jgi:hypothetical protein